MIINPKNETAFVVKYLQIIVKFSGQRIDQPHYERFLFDANDVVMKIPVSSYNDEGQKTTIVKEYALWQLSEVVLNENPHILKSKHDLVDAWFWEKVMSKHPLRNKMLDYRLAVYEDVPVPKTIKYNSLIDELL
jgi:hypothetical protein